MQEIKNSDKNALKAKKRRRLQIIRRIKVIGGLCAGLALVLYLLSAFVFFKISVIDVVGITDEDIILKKRIKEIAINGMKLVE